MQLETVLRLPHSALQEICFLVQRRKWTQVDAPLLARRAKPQGSQRVW